MAEESVKNTNNVQKLLLSRYVRRFTAGQQAHIGVGLGDINQAELMRDHSLILISRMYPSGITIR